MKAKDIKNKKSYIELLDGKHEITFDFNALEELETTYGSMDIAIQEFSGDIKIKAIKSFMCAGINACIEDEEKHLTPYQLGKLLSIQETPNYVDILTAVFDRAMPEDEPSENEGESEKN